MGQRMCKLAATFNPSKHPLRSRLWVLKTTLKHNRGSYNGKIACRGSIGKGHFEAILGTIEDIAFEGVGMVLKGYKGFGCWGSLEGKLPAMLFLESFRGFFGNLLLNIILGLF